MDNPSGKPRTAEQTTELDARQKAGEAAQARMAKDAQEMKAAKDQSGSK